MPSYNMGRYNALNAITLRLTLSNKYTCNCSTPNLKIEWVKSRKRHHILYLSCHELVTQAWKSKVEVVQLQLFKAKQGKKRICYCSTIYLRLRS